jgi:hypothetical protein
MIRSRFPLVGLAFVIALFAFAVPAQAHFHLNKVNEVMLSSGGDSTAQFVEFSDPAEDFPCIGLGDPPYHLVVYGSNGSKTDSQDLSCGAPLQALFAVDNRMYVATGTAPGPADVPLSVVLPTAAGAVCFTSGATESNKVSCASWGCPTGFSGASSSTQIPADGQSLQRQGNGTLNTASPTPNAVNTAGTATTGCSASSGGGGSGDTPGTGTTPPAASVAPLVELSGASSSKLKKGLSVTVECPNAPCLASASGTLSVPNTSKTFKIKSDPVQIAQGAKATLKIKLSSKARKAAKAALKAGKKVRAKLKVTATNSAGSNTAKKTIKLKR